MDQATPTPVTGASPRAVPPVQVGLDYINQHDGSSTTLLLAESLLANPTAGSGSQVFVPRADASGNSLAKWTTPTALATTTGTDPGTTNANALLVAQTSAGYSTSTPPNLMEAAVGFEWSQWSASPKLTDKILSRHPGGVNVSFCDGHQQFIAESVDVNTFKLLMTPYGNAIPGASTGTMSTIPPWVEQPVRTDALQIPSLPPAGTLLNESSY